MRLGIFALLAVLIQYSSAIDTSSTKYLPLKVGNIWVYEYNSVLPPPGGTHYRFKSTVLKDTTANSHKYYFIDNMLYIKRYENLNWFRVDSLNGNFMAYKYSISCRPGGEELIDSLASDTNTIAAVCSTPEAWRKCYSAGNIVVFGQTVYSKFFDYLGMVNGVDNKRYAKKFGILYTYTVDPGSYTITLIGCVIDGVKYGDTSIIGIQPVSSQIPLRYGLYQNYPNPFNPTTKIKFDLASVGTVSRTVRLVIYDMLGREVATLVNEELKPGTYEVEWDGSGFSSGVYFYALVVGENTNNGGYRQTNKMVLIK